MKFKTKLYLSLLALIFFTTFIGLAAVYWEVHRILFEEFRSKVMTVAATGAQFIDASQLEKIHTREDIHSPAFNEVVDEMRSIRRVNRRQDLYVIYIYTLRPDPIKRNSLLIVADATDDQSNFSYPGDTYPEGVEFGILNHLNEVWSPDHLITDRWGTFLSGYAPIYNSQGEYVCTLGVDLSGHFVIEEMSRLKLLVLSILALTLIVGFVAAAFVSHGVSDSLEKINEAVHLIGHGNLKARVFIPGNDEFSQLALAINEMATGLEQHEKLKLNFVRYVSKHVMEKILSTDTPPALLGERRKITVLFSDIREFTRLAEKLPPEEVVALLNQYLEKMLNVIFANNGTLDKFIGDGLMVEFGAPLDDSEQERHAVETALQMQAALAELNEKWAQEKKPLLEMGIGVHTGTAVVGNIGSERRMEYTAIGDTVNVASRLEHASKDLHVSILVSETTRQNLPAKYRTTPLGSITLPGRDSPIEVFSVEK